MSSTEHTAWLKTMDTLEAEYRSAVGHPMSLEAFDYYTDRIKQGNKVTTVIKEMRQDRRLYEQGMAERWNRKRKELFPLHKEFSLSDEHKIREAVLHK